MTWTDPAKARLKVLWATGLSASQCAADRDLVKEAGPVTRAAICGQVFRMGLVGRSRAAAIVSVAMGRPLLPLDRLRDPARAARREAAKPTGRVIPSHLKASAASSALKSAPPTLASGAEPAKGRHRGGHASGILTSIKNNEAADAGKFNSDTEPKDLPADVSPFAVTFEQLQAVQCRWPMGDPADFDTFRFCGAPSGESGPYCTRHAALASDGIPRSRRIPNEWLPHQSPNDPA